MFTTSESEAKSSRRRSVGFFAGAFTFTGLFIASGYVSNSGGIKVFTIFDVRVFSLAVAAFVLIRLLVSIPLKKPILEQLIRINRDLSLDRISAKTAQDQIDIALYGLRSSDILQKYVDKYLKVMEQLNKEMKQVSQKVEIRNSMLKKKSKETSSKDRILEEFVKNDIALHLVRIEKLLNSDLYKSLLPLVFQTFSLATASKYSSAYEKNKQELLTVLIDVQSGVKTSFDEVRSIRDEQGISGESTEPIILVLIDQLISRV
ncbi:MAG: hypothetical protein QM730_04100 [Anaerolineales bacterium]